MPKQARYKAALRATIVNSSTHTLLAIFKIIVGYFGHSQALIADGIHSFSDLITDALVLFAARIGDQMPDKEHPYGHRRVETIAAIIISIVLIGVAAGIAYDTIHHILAKKHLLKPDIYVVIVAVISILANEGLFRYTLYEGNKINSDLLRTNAWHNRSDVLVSIIVLVSVVGTMFGITYLDSIGALVIAVLILKMGIKLIWQGTKELIDTGVDEEMLHNITQAILSIPGVRAIHQLRTRSHGGTIFADVHIQVSPNISVSEGHFISEKVHIYLIKNFQEIDDVTVHIDPENDETSIPSLNLPDREKINRLLKTRWEWLPGYNKINRILLHYLNGKLYVEVYMPLTVIQATTNQQQLQKDYQAAAKDITDIAKISLYFEGNTNG
ncbi:cation diffusion facilitator family transporter [Candidiatus Paracoxiella cheracis]|uniref:cation diffusion facilitator family transporter n=1 Tax=Candidiatus Paracoxiella cheracis TaxID=3405120 RepID=UPI003BF5A536